MTALSGEAPQRPATPRAAPPPLYVLLLRPAGRVIGTGRACNNPTRDASTERTPALHTHTYTHTHTHTYTDRDTRPERRSTSGRPPRRAASCRNQLAPCAPPPPHPEPQGE